MLSKSRSFSSEYPYSILYTVHSRTLPVDLCKIPVNFYANIPVQNRTTNCVSSIYYTKDNDININLCSIKSNSSLCLYEISIIYVIILLLLIHQDITYHLYSQIYSIYVYSINITSNDDLLFFSKYFYVSR